MPNFEQILNDKLQAFNKKYKLQLASDQLNIRQANASGDALKNNYKELVTQSLLDYLSNAMAMKKNESYDFTQFSISDFTKEFDELMQAKCNIQHIGARPDYEGIKLDELFDFMKEKATPYSTFLPNLWGKDLMEGRMTVESMREVTSDASAILLGDGADSPNKMRQVSKNALKTLVAAQQAMTSVRERRGFLFVIFHPILNYREKNYLKDLNKSVKECEAKKFDVEGVKNDLMNIETLQETFENLSNHEAYDYKYEEAVNIERHRKEREYKNGVVRNVIHAHAGKINNPEFQKDIAEKLLDSLPDGGSLKYHKRKIIEEKSNAFLKEAGKANEAYSFNLNVENAQEYIQSYARRMFSFALELTEGMKYNMTGRLLAAQRMTDVIMNAISPVPLSPEILGKYGDGYLLNNPEMIAWSVAVRMGKSQADEATMNIISNANEAFQGLKNKRLPLKYANGGLDERKEDDAYELLDSPISIEEIFSLDVYNAPKHLPATNNNQVDKGKPPFNK